MNRRRGSTSCADADILALDTDYEGWVLDDMWDEPRMSAFRRDRADVFAH